MIEAMTLFPRRQACNIRHKQSLFKLNILIQNGQQIFGVAFPGHIEQQILAKLAVNTNKNDGKWIDSSICLL